jgi:histidinol-phosphatase
VHPDLSLALRLADDADAISLARFGALDLRVETKPDLTPVTDADRAVESALLEVLGRERPDDAVLGEEHGVRPGPSGRRWIVDPIDGTRNFLRGIPIWATLIALEQDGGPAVGVASAPALGRRWWARLGDGAFTDGRALRSSRVARISDAVFSYASRRDAGAELAREVWHARGFGDFWQHMLVAEGAVDIAVDHVVDVWDIAAVRVIVEAAGGRCTDLDGGPALTSGSLVSTNGLLHEEVLRRLRAPASR